MFLKGFHNLILFSVHDGSSSSATQPISAIRYCFPSCKVIKDPTCCYNPGCYQRKKTICDWFSYTEGELSKGNREGHSQKSLRLQKKCISFAYYFMLIQEKAVNIPKIRPMASGIVSPMGNLSIEEGWSLQQQMVNMSHTKVTMIPIHSAAKEMLQKVCPRQSWAYWIMFRTC